MWSPFVRAGGHCRALCAVFCFVVLTPGGLTMICQVELILTWKDRYAHQNGPLAAADDDFEAKPAGI